MTPPILVGAGLGALALGLLVLRSFGPGYRIGRLLSATPTVGIGEALRIASAGEARYVAVTGRIDSETDFEDENHRPLVFRRVRLEARRDGRWAPIDDRREAVDFEVGDALGAIGVDHGALDEGLVVIPRESIGLAGDAPDLLPVPLAPETPVRMRVEQVSSVEHAIVVGVPSLGADGTARMAAGRGRPLLLTTLERDEAMRVLAGGSRIRAGAAAVALGGGVVLLAAGLALGVLGALTSRAPEGVSTRVTAPATIRPAQPGNATPSGGVEGGAGDTRSAGQGPGFVGAPLVAVLAVLALGLGTAGLTLAYVRLTGGPGDSTSAGRGTGGEPRPPGVG